MNKNMETETKLRNSEQYVAKSWIRKHWKRSMGLAHGKTQKELFREAAKGKTILNRAIDFLDIRVFKWIYHYLKSRFGSKCEFPDYTPFKDDNGIYALLATPSKPDAAEPVRISLVGDWATGTREAHGIAEFVKKDSVHFTIHLGDIYYVGTKFEVKDNMLGGKAQWPLGSRGSFALNANHEMYARGKGYFKYLLSSLDIRNGNGGMLHKQRASFFCLKNEHWLVIGLDTGYHSIGIPILELIINPNARLHSKLMEWLCKDVLLQDDKQRGVILLSHHQYYSQFESGYDKPASQIAQLLNRPVLWFWGHEHRYAIYGRYTTKRGRLQAYGRCVGHGGLPIEDIEDKPKSCRKCKVGLVLYDRRERTRVGKSQTPVGYNGYANLIFEGKRLTVEYKDTKQTLVKEKWEVGDGGVLKGISIEQLVDDDDLVIHEGSRLEDAIT